jgi:hypothetical protein
MSQIHKRFTDEQVKVLFAGYCQGQLSRADLQELLGIGKSRFFALLKAYRQDPEGFSIAYQRATPAKLRPETEEALRAALLQEKTIVEDPDLPISSYNYAGIRDRLQANMTFDRYRGNCITRIQSCRIAHERANSGPNTGLNRSRKAALDTRTVRTVSEDFLIVSLVRCVQRSC